MDEAELLVSFLQTVINNRSAEEKKKQKKRSPSLSERLESPSYEMKITQKDEQFFHDKFKLGEAEKLHAVYNCALFNAADFFGKLYVSDQHICYFNTDVNQLTKQNKVRHKTSIFRLKYFTTLHIANISFYWQFIFPLDYYPAEWSYGCGQIQSHVVNYGLKNLNKS